MTNTLIFLSVLISLLVVVKKDIIQKHENCFSIKYREQQFQAPILQRNDWSSESFQTLIPSRITRVILYGRSFGSSFIEQGIWVTDKKQILHCITSLRNQIAEKDSFASNYSSPQKGDYLIFYTKQNDDGLEREIRYKLNASNPDDGYGKEFREWVQSLESERANQFREFVRNNSIRITELNFPKYQKFHDTRSIHRILTALLKAPDETLFGFTRKETNCVLECKLANGQYRIFSLVIGKQVAQDEQGRSLGKIDRPDILRSYVSARKNDVN